MDFGTRIERQAEAGTIGMPYSGAVKAVRSPTDTLFGRTLLGIGTRLREALVTAARTMPSVRQLPPTYQCVTDHASGTRLDAVPLPLPDLDSGMVDDAFAFRRELDEAVRRNTEADRWPAALPRTGCSPQAARRRRPTLRSV
ncbi:hypothetical protein AB0M41_32345 [Streptomyces sp. NPDC051896]|uniref:hypothetical protein n=1 Tax=Streptomyces sp. NPDC051896 TaxID=3155416 RepID=UPI0034485E08